MQHQDSQKLWRKAQQKISRKVCKAAPLPKYLKTQDHISVNLFNTKVNALWESRFSLLTPKFALKLGFIQLQSQTPEREVQL